MYVISFASHIRVVYTNIWLIRDKYKFVLDVHGFLDKLYHRHDGNDDDIGVCVYNICMK